MKKFYYLLLLLPFSLFFSCNDKDFSPVDMTLTLEGVTSIDNGFYTVAGENVILQNFEASSLDGSNTGVSNVMINLNGMPLLPEPDASYITSFSTENLRAGTYSLNITGTLLQEGSSVMNFALSYPVTIVDSEEDLPAGAPAIGTYSQTVRFSESK